jgi:hypothetical protein
MAWRSVAAQENRVPWSSRLHDFDEASCVPLATVSRGLMLWWHVQMAGTSLRQNPTATPIRAVRGANGCVWKSSTPAAAGNLPSAP